jgi:hypothetical protein
MIRQGTNQERVDQTQDGGIGPNGQREREDGDENECRALGQTSPRKSEILQHIASGILSFDSWLP